MTTTPPAPTSGGYVDGVLANTVDLSSERIRRMEELFDPLTEQVLSGLGLPPEGRFAELGAGCGSVARWLARTYPGAEVWAGDIEPTLFDSAGLPNLTITQHDVRADRLPPGGFDLVHCRALLVHLPDREEVIRRISDYVAPGGWLVVEEPVLSPLGESAYPAFRRLVAATEEILRRTGSDVHWPPRLAHSIGALGWADLGMSALMCPCVKGSLASEVWRVAAAQAVPAMVANGLISAEDAAAGVACLDDEGFAEIGFGLVSGWARRRDCADPRAAHAR